MGKASGLLRAFFVHYAHWAVVIIFAALCGVQINTMTRASSVNAYPRAIISYGLAGARTDEEIVATVEQWKKDSWGAQIGALRVLCDSDREFIDKLGGQVVGAKLCRVSR